MKQFTEEQELNLIEHLERRGFNKLNQHKPFAIKINDNGPVAKLIYIRIYNVGYDVALKTIDNEWSFFTIAHRAIFVWEDESAILDSIVDRFSD